MVGLCVLAPSTLTMVASFCLTKEGGWLLLSCIFAVPFRAYVCLYLISRYEPLTRVGPSPVFWGCDECANVHPRSHKCVCSKTPVCLLAFSLPGLFFYTSSVAAVISLL